MNTNETALGSCTRHLVEIRTDLATAHSWLGVLIFILTIMFCLLCLSCYVCLETELNPPESRRQSVHEMRTIPSTTNTNPIRFNIPMDYTYTTYPNLIMRSLSNEDDDTTYSSSSSSGSFRDDYSPPSYEAAMTAAAASPESALPDTHNPQDNVNSSTQQA